MHNRYAKGKRNKAYKNVIDGTMEKQYKVIKDGITILTPIPGKHAGWWQGKIFGRPECGYGRFKMKENRVWFAELGDAIKCGFRPCNKHKPIGGDDFRGIKSM